MTPTEHDERTDGPLAEPAAARRWALPGFRRKPRPAPCLSDGIRVYAIGDVHGRLDLLDTLLTRIAADDATRGLARTHVVVLGDLVDRGPDSAGVVRRTMAGLPWATMTTLRGNHEQMMLDALDGDREPLRSWLLAGGDTTLCSWGVDRAIVEESALGDVRTAADAAIPPAERGWIARLPRSITFGDYHFVHAGIRPGVPLDRQADRDMLWIRRQFLESDADHGVVVVHGHTVTRRVEVRHNRIGIDTGACFSGRLTALGLEATARWTVSTLG